MSDLYARFQMLGACACLGRLPSRVGQLLVRDGKRHVVRDPPRNRHVARVERAEPLRPERERNLLLVSLAPHEHQRSEAGGPCPFPEIDGLDHVEGFGLEVVQNQERLAAFAESPPESDARMRQDALVGCGLHQRFPFAIVERHRQSIVRKGLARDLGNLGKYLANVEDRGEGAQQLVGRFDVLGALAFERERPLKRVVVQRAIDRQRHLVRNQRQERHVVRMIGARLAIAGHQHAHSPLRRRQGQPTRGLYALAPHVLHGLRKSRFVLDDGDEQRLLMLHHPVGDRVLGGKLRRRHWLAGGLQQERLYGVRLVVVERQAEEIEIDDAAELARETPKQRVAIVAGAECLGDADERLVTLDCLQLDCCSRGRQHHFAV